MDVAEAAVVARVSGQDLDLELEDSCSGYPDIPRGTASSPTSSSSPSSSSGCLTASKDTEPSLLSVSVAGEGGGINTGLMPDLHMEQQLRASVSYIFGYDLSEMLQSALDCPAQPTSSAAARRMAATESQQTVGCAHHVGQPRPASRSAAAAARATCCPRSRSLPDTQQQLVLSQDQAQQQQQVRQVDEGNQLVQIEEQQMV